MEFMAKLIKLTKGKFAIVDSEDFEWLNHWKWHAAKSGNYAGREEAIGGGKSRFILLHRLIMGAIGKVQVDHKNGNGLDNRKENLRLCSNKDNQRNHKLLVTNTSGFNGVSWNKDRKKWEACISVDHKTKHLGCFHDKLEAAKSYNKAAIIYFGEFARLNQIRGYYGL